MCVYSQLKSCSVSEAAAMIEGVLRHCTDVEIDRQYTDTHGASIIGFAFAHMLGFTLLLLLQDILGEEKWQERLTDADRRALSPLFWTHVDPYGRFELDMNSRLDLDLSIRTTVPGPLIPQGETAAAPA
ncbi:transposase [Streptomyces sp. NBC_00199]|nr:Tn3 family transposase [Streptomyces sp. NBC_00199]MCX5263345.1 transposase [Streptomyces sp. NBC_00199]